MASSKLQSFSGLELGRGLLAANILLLISLSSSIPALAMPTSAEIRNALNKAQFLAPGTAVNVRVDKDQVFVSTYRHSNDEKDCKIDSVLISKAVFDTAPEELGRVTCYFYGKDMSNYQEVSVTAGDIKAFASGSMSKDQLLSSLSVKTSSTSGQNATEKVENQLESNSITRPTNYKINVGSDLVTVNTALDPWVSDEDSKLEALRIAVNVFKAQPSAQQIRVNFVDPAATAENREMTFATANLASMWKEIQTPLQNLAIAKRPPTIDVQSLRTVKGVKQVERDALLKELKEMDSLGIGIAPFVKVFLGIEQTVKREGDPKAIAEMLTRLISSVDDQMKAYKSAKEKKPTVKAAEPPPDKSQPAPAMGSRWVTGKNPVIEPEVLQGPDAVVNRFESELGAGFKSANENPRFLAVLDQVSAILIKNNRAAEAAKFQQRAAQIRASARRK